MNLQRLKIYQRLTTIITLFAFVGLAPFLGTDEPVLWLILGTLVANYAWSCITYDLHEHIKRDYVKRSKERAVKQVGDNPRELALVSTDHLIFELVARSEAIAGAIIFRPDSDEIRVQQFVQGHDAYCAVLAGLACEKVLEDAHPERKVLLNDCVLRPKEYLEDGYVTGESDDNYRRYLAGEEEDTDA